MTTSVALVTGSCDGGQSVWWSKHRGDSEGLPLTDIQGPCGYHFRYAMLTGRSTLRVIVSIGMQREQAINMAKKLGFSSECVEEVYT